MDDIALCGKISACRPTGMYCKSATYRKHRGQNRFTAAPTVFLFHSDHISNTYNKNEYTTKQVEVNLFAALWQRRLNYPDRKKRAV